jgi:hypothetical protein
LKIYLKTEKVYHEAMKKSSVQIVLLAPKVKGLENEKAGPIKRFKFIKACLLFYRLIN